MEKQVQVRIDYELRGGQKHSAYFDSHHNGEGDYVRTAEEQAKEWFGRSKNEIAYFTPYRDGVFDPGVLL